MQETKIVPRNTCSMTAYLAIFVRRQTNVNVPSGWVEPQPELKGIPFDFSKYLQMDDDFEN